MLEPEKLEELFTLLKKHRVFVFQDGDVKVQFEQSLLPSEMPAQRDEREQGEAEKQEYEATLYASAGG